MTFIRRVGTVIAAAALTIGLAGASPASAARDTSWGGYGIVASQGADR